MDANNTPLAEHAKATENTKFKQSGHIDDEILVKFSHLVTALDAEAESKDFTPLIEFIQKEYAVQAMQTWSYYAQVNNHPKLIEATIVLTKALEVLGSAKNVIEYGGVLIKVILTNYTRVLYRGLNNIRASITIPTIRLMKQMVKYNSGQYIEDFTTNFDFSLHSLPKILTVTKGDIASFNGKNKHHRLYIRFEFIEFWLTLISMCPPLLRKDIISQNFKIMSAWFKQMDKADTVELMDHTLDVLDKKILDEKAFKRMTKTHILNELALSKIYSFLYSSSETLVQKVCQFFLTYGANSETSVAFPCNHLWQDSPISGSSNGVLITVNQKEFRIYNKLLFNILKIFKPWESDIQSSIVLKILNHVPELVPPYCHFLASHGSLDPKMTAYWFGCMTVLGRIIKLKIPQCLETTQTTVIPSLELVIQTALPEPISKLSLTKSLQHEKMIVRYLACQVLIFSFQKLQKILELYDRKGWSFASAPLRNLFYQSVPDLPIITSAMNQSYLIAKNNRVMQLSLTLLLKYYSTTFPSFFQISIPSSNIFVDIMQKDEFSGLDLVIVDNFLQFQELNGIQTKWWNASAREYSLFTSLLKMASSKNSMDAISEKIHQLLKGMLHGTVVFNDLLSSPQRALIHSLQILSFEDSNSEDLSKVWKLLDETISRCIRTPYRYVDMSKNYQKISPFLVVLSEQWKFVDKTSSDIPAKWLCIFLRTMVISGESATGIKKLAEDLLTDVPAECIETYLSFEKYDFKAQKLFSDESYLLSNFQETSFCEHITTMPYEKISKLTRYPLNELDAVGIIWRLQNLMIDSKINPNNRFREIVDILLAKLANYLMSNPTFNIFNSNIIISFFPTDTTVEQEKCYFVAHAIIQLYQELKLTNPSFEQFAFNWLRNHMELLKSTDNNAMNFVFAICSVLNAKDCMELLQSDEEIQAGVLEFLLWKMLRQNHVAIPYKILKSLKNGFASLDELLAQFIEQDRIENFEPDHFIRFSLQNFKQALGAFLHSKWFSLDLLQPYLSQIAGTEVALTVALAIYESNSLAVKEFLQEELGHCIQGVSQQKLSLQGLELFCLCSEMLSEKQKIEILEYATSIYPGKYHSLVVKFVTIANNFELPCVVAWLNKSILYGTKYLSHETQVSGDISEFFSRLEELMNVINIWSKVNHTYLRAQIEVILKGPWVSNSDILQYTMHLLLKGKGDDVQCRKMLQCLLNNENNTLKISNSDAFHRFATAATIFILFKMDSQQNSNRVIQSILLGLYSATITCEDRIILSILEEIETNTSVSWTDELCSLDFLEGEDTGLVEMQSVRKTIVRERQELFVTLDKNIILNTANNYVLRKPVVPSRMTWEDLMSFYRENKKIFASIDGIVYDPTFLMLLSIQSEANLINYSVLGDGSTKCTFEVQRLLSSGMFRILLTSLADIETQAISLHLLHGILHSLEDNKQFRYGEILDILLKKIVYTFESAKQESRLVNISSCVWFAISRIPDLLLNPGTALHEKAYRWVLSSPIILEIDYPLLQDLTTPHERNKDHENFYKQLTWVLECLELGIKTEQDVSFLRNKNVFEWLFNLRNLSYLNGRLCAIIDSIFYKIQRLDSGASVLLTRFAAVSSLEIQKLSLGRKINNATNVLTENKNDKKTLRNKLLLQTQQLNVDELLQSQVETFQSQKRLRDWVEEDQANVIKRICM
ncbi:URB1 (YKL014C) [Zygosaccharomyces parabailii]|nr:URB1 (YKL014C) [Zygosaccharomyces parabailii]